MTLSAPMRSGTAGIWSWRRLDAHHSTSVFLVFSCRRLLLIHVDISPTQVERASCSGATPSVGCCYPCDGYAKIAVRNIIQPRLLCCGFCQIYWPRWITSRWPSLLYWTWVQPLIVSITTSCQSCSPVLAWEVSLLPGSCHVWLIDPNVSYSVGASR